MSSLLNETLQDKYKTLRSKIPASPAALACAVNAVRAFKGFRRYLVLLEGTVSFLCSGVQLFRRQRDTVFGSIQGAWFKGERGAIDDAEASETRKAVA